MFSNNGPHKMHHGIIKEAYESKSMQDSDGNYSYDGFRRYFDVELEIFQNNS